MLIQEALQAQSANVDMVSGATYSSQGVHRLAPGSAHEGAKVVTRCSLPGVRPRRAHHGDADHRRRSRRGVGATRPRAVFAWFRVVDARLQHVQAGQRDQPAEPRRAVDPRRDARRARGAAALRRAPRGDRRLLRHTSCVAATSTRRATSRGGLSIAPPHSCAGSARRTTRSTPAGMFCSRRRAAGAALARGRAAPVPAGPHREGRRRLGARGRDVGRIRARRRTSSTRTRSRRRPGSCR